MGDQKFGAAKNTYTAHVTPSNTGTDGTIGQRTFPAERRGNALQRALLWFLNLTDASPLPWYKWPLLSVWPLVYLYLRRVLLRLNLVDIPQPKNTDIGRKLKGYEGRASLEHFFRRDDNGWGNDVDHPDAGAQFATIGRNMAYIPTDALDPFEDPHPQLVAQKLLARTFFRPAGMQLNVMAAAWIQAMIHDWQDHELEKNLDKRVELAHKTNPVCPLANFKLRPTYNHGTDGAHVYLNTRTGWWDASFVYGQNQDRVSGGRTFSLGSVAVKPDGSLIIKENGIIGIGDQMNSWAGITVLQDLFVREHSAVAKAIAAAHPELDDEGIFHTARLVIAALIAKIHTVDWTVELLKTRALKEAIFSNWYGLFNWGVYGFGLLGKAKAKNHGVKFSLTEEFTAVYRLHPMIPDKLLIRDSEGIKAVPIESFFGSTGNKELMKRGVPALLESLLRYPCGALCLFNYPKALRKLRTTNEYGEPEKEQSEIDLAAVDIYRDRERGVPRYNDFRRHLNMNPMKDWKELTGGDEEAIKALTEVYGPDGIDKCDLLVGNLAEKKIPGFAISETSFMLFLLMAARRVEADRFLTENFTEQVYTKTGMDWITKTRGLRDVLRRHYPDIEREIPPGDSAFTPYQQIPMGL